MVPVKILIEQPMLSNYNKLLPDGAAGRFRDRADAGDEVGS